MSADSKGAASEGGSQGRLAGAASGGGEQPCYFCNDTFQLGQLQNHLKQCGSILEQCPLRCGAWLQRRHKERHAAECPRGATSHARLPDPAADHTWAPGTVALEDCLSFLEKEVATIKLVLTEEVNIREVQYSEVAALRSRLGLLEQRLQTALVSLDGQRAALDDDTQRAAAHTERLQRDLDLVQHALQELRGQQLSTALRLDSVESSVLHEQRERELMEQAITEHHQRIRGVRKLEEVIEYIKRAVEEERARNEAGRAALDNELAEARRSSEQLAELAELRAQLQGAALEHSPVAQVVDRMAVLELRMAEERAEREELAARLELAGRDVRALARSYLKLRAEVADGQARASTGVSAVLPDDGHLIWRIDNFAARMKDAKENDSVLCSPLFRTSKFGYTLKAEVHLNGIGKWKGRHLTCTVRVAPGAYDPLLRWPCDLEISVVLRDQPADRNQAMDISKSLEVKKKSSAKRHDYDSAGDKSSELLDKSVVQLKRQYIFIPHTSLDKFDYIKNDVMFLEFLVNK